MTQTLLMIEASTDHASVAVIADGRVLVERAVVTRRPDTGARTEGIVPAIVACLAEAHLTSRELSGVVCSAGPGGFTSLRTAASIGKGLCYALHIPLYAVPTLDLIVADAAQADGVYVAALDAGRGEYYVGVVDVRNGAIGIGHPMHVISAAELDRFVGEHHATLVGPVQGRSGTPRAGAVVRLLSQVVAGQGVNVDSWEPSYGRLAEAQAKWEATHGRPLSA